MKRAFTTFLVALLFVGVFTFGVKVQPIKAQQTQSGLTLTLSTAKTSYNVGEPINIALTLTNISNQTIAIDYDYLFFDLLVYNLEGLLLYQWSQTQQVVPMCIISYTLNPGEYISNVLTWPQLANMSGSSQLTQVPAGYYDIYGEVPSYDLQTAPLLVEITTGANPSASLSVSISPVYAVLNPGQSQIFNSTVTGGVPPYTYQWHVDSIAAIPSEVNPTFNYTAPLDGAGIWHNIWISVTDSASSNADSAPAMVLVQTLGAPVYYSVEAVPIAPLTNLNSSINGLKTPALPSVVGENFTVAIHLMNATATNAPNGVGGVEVHFYFGNLLNYCKVVGFTDYLGQPGGALLGPVINVYEGFYDDNQNAITVAPYANATQYMVAAGSTSGPWNGEDGLVATITFQITKQPSSKDQDFYGQLQIGFAALTDCNGVEIPFSVTQGTLHINAASALVGDLNGDGVVNLQDLILLANAYGSKPGDSNWNPNAAIAPPYGIISLTDLVTLAMHYGQHYP